MSSSKSDLFLVDSILVEVTVKSSTEPFEQRDSGIYAPNEEAKEKPLNFGKVLKVPAHITEKEYEFYLDALDEGHVVFFSANRSYNYIPQGDENIKLLIIPLRDIDAYYSPTSP